MKRKEILICTIIAFICITGIIYMNFSAKSGNTVVITHAGKTITADISKDDVIDIEGKNKVTIQNREVYMSYADCPDKLCIHQGRIKNSGKSIICLPNDITVSISGEPTVDAVSR